MIKYGGGAIYVSYSIFINCLGGTRGASLCSRVHLWMYTICKCKKIIWTFFECLYVPGRQCVETILLDWKFRWMGSSCWTTNKQNRSRCLASWGQIIETNYFCWAWIEIESDFSMTAKCSKIILIILTIL